MAITTTQTHKIMIVAISKEGDDHQVYEMPGAMLTSESGYLDMEGNFHSGIDRFIERPEAFGYTPVTRTVVESTVRRED